MFDILSNQNISLDVQEFFKTSISIQEENALIFKYGNDYEYYCPGIHLIPSTKGIWKAGNINPNFIRQVFICQSAMEAIAYLAFNISQYRTTEQIAFLAVGNLSNSEQYCSILKDFKHKKISLIMGNDLFGRISDIKIALGLRKKKVEISLRNYEILNLLYQGKSYEYSYNSLTLNSFEKQTGFRSGIRTFKSKLSNSFFIDLYNKSL